MVALGFPDLTVVTRFEWVPPQRAAVAAVLTPVLAAALAVDVHALRDLGYPLHQRAAQAFLGVALLLEVRVVGEHLLTLVDFELGVQLLQLILQKEGL